MAEALILAVAKSALSKLPSIHADLAAEHSGVDFKSLEENLIKICAILIDVGNKQFDSSAIIQLSEVVFYVDDLLDEIITDARQKRVDKGSLLQQVKNSFSRLNIPLSRQSRDLYRKLSDSVDYIQRLGSYLAIESTPSDEYHYYHDHHDYGYKVNKSHFVFGREEDKHIIIKRLSSLSDDNHCSLFSICGDEGVGKTTLAELVYYDRWVRENFDLMLWASNAGDEREIMECIVNAVYGDGSRDLSLEMLEQRGFDAIRDKKCFLVLDDVRRENDPVCPRLRDALKAGKRGSVILVTRRSASISDEFTVGPLTEDAALSMFSHLVFNGTEGEKYPNLVEIGRSIIQKSDGIPLWIRLVGGMLWSIRDETEWRRIADTFQPSPSMEKWVRLAYSVLPPHLRACCAYSHMLLTDDQIFSSHLINYWRAQGLLQEISSQEKGELGYKCFNELLMRSFLQDSTFLFNNCAGHIKMHESLQLSLQQFIQEQAVVIDNNLITWWTAKHVVLRSVNESLFANVRGELTFAKRLRTLKFDRKLRHVSRSLLERVISFFKKLRVLDVSNCNVTELPNSIGELKHLRLLNLSGNRAIKRLPRTISKLYNLQTLNLDGCERLEEVPRTIHELYSLSYISITSQQLSLSSIKFNKLSSLQHLELFSCWGLTSLWADDKPLTSLRKLHIFNCKRLAWFPCSMICLINLEELVIHNCPELDLMGRKGLYGLKSLRSLEIVGIQKLVEFPSELSSATELQHFLISDCQNLRRLWRPIPNLTSLQTLCIYDCPKLLMLPLEFCSLTALQSLDIRQCPCMSRVFSRRKGYGWRLISFIPEVIVNGWWLRFQGCYSTKSSSSIIWNQYLPRRLSYFSSKLTIMQVRYSEGRGKGEDGFLEPIRQSRWEVLSLAFNAIVRMRNIVKEKAKSKLSDDRSLGQQSIPKKSSRWRSLWQRHREKLRSLYREKYRSQLLLLSDAELEMMLHCYLFDDNYEFERDKLVQLWIAAKLLQNEPLEDEGQRFFDFLVQKNYIFLSRVDNLTQMRIYKAKLQELYASFALIPEKITKFLVRVGDGNMVANRVAGSWHITVQSGTSDHTIFEILKKYRNLRTLIFLKGSLIKQVPYGLFLDLNLLTILDLSGSSIAELPSSIGDAKELCYLDLSRTPIKRLPQSIVCLQKLQTLRLKDCVHLFRLPQGTKELVNLRHLDFDVLGQLSCMPRGIGALVKLRTLPAFIVDSEESCNIRELKHMNNLSGKFCISGLEHVLNSEDAMEVDLTNKEHLKQLELRWSDIVQFHEDEEQCFSGVLECLKPSFELEELQILCFPGLLLPSWISDPQYIKLVSITLFKCETCHTLPSLGQLPKLKSLDIIEMNGVKRIDDKFCGVDMYHEAFPMLEMLAMDGMLNLEAWMGVISGKCPRLVKLSIKRCPQLREVDSFPYLHSLKHLEVTHCPLLEYLSVEMLTSPLETVVIDACPMLERRYSKGGEVSRQLRHVPNVWIDSDDTQSSDEDDTQDVDSVRGNSSLKKIHSSDEEAFEDDIFMTGHSKASSVS